MIYLQRDGFYIRRYAPMKQLKKMQEERKFEVDKKRFRSLSLINLALPFIMYLGCIFICIMFFLVEYYLLSLLFKRVVARISV